MRNGKQYLLVDQAEQDVLSGNCDIAVVSNYVHVLDKELATQIEVSMPPTAKLVAGTATGLYIFQFRSDTEAVAFLCLTGVVTSFEDLRKAT